MNGIQEVSGSIPIISTMKTVETTGFQRFFVFSSFPDVEFVLNACGIGVTCLPFPLYGLLLRSDICCIFIPHLVVALCLRANIMPSLGALKGPSIMFSANYATSSNTKRTRFSPLSKITAKVVHTTYLLLQNKISYLFPGVAQLVARVVWDHQAAGSNPVTRTRISGHLF